jgi:hypothetical protein
MTRGTRQTDGSELFFDRDRLLRVEGRRIGLRRAVHAARTRLRGRRAVLTFPITWTVDEAEDMRAAFLLCPYSITTNRPDLLARMIG